MAASILPNEQRKLRNGWWVGIFVLLLASFVFSDILLSKHFHFEITILHQGVIIVVTSVVCQLLRKESPGNLMGALNYRWIRELLIGILLGMLLMLTPALFLYAAGGVSWQINKFDFLPILSATLLFVGVAITEEFLFRGFLFRRLIDGLGLWWAQLIIGGMFLLTHTGNPGMTGNIKVFASINIFLASIMFGLAFFRTKSLAMPLGLHFMANWTQGVALGFGVSGLEQPSILKPIFYGSPEWLTGGSFGLEASVPGMVSVIATVIILYAWKPFASRRLY
jgi:membrane protease YdiL (CAAX protease family)